MPLIYFIDNFLKVAFILEIILMQFAIYSKKLDQELAKNLSFFIFLSEKIKFAHHLIIIN